MFPPRSGIVFTQVVHRVISRPTISESLSAVFSTRLVIATSSAVVAVSPLVPAIQAIVATAIRKATSLRAIFTAVVGRLAASPWAILIAAFWERHLEVVVVVLLEIVVLIKSLSLDTAVA